MTDERSLLDAIRAAPDDDTLRLAYADWLEEHGRERYARYVRLAIGRGIPLHVFPEGMPASVMIVEPDRGVLLLNLAPGLSGLTWTVARGLPEACACPAVVWLARGDELYRTLPVVAVSLTTTVHALRLPGPPDAIPSWHLPGRTEVVLGYPGENVEAALLAAAWPGVRFTYPPPLVLRPVRPWVPRAPIRLPEGL